MARYDTAHALAASFFLVVMSDSVRAEDDAIELSELVVINRVEESLHDIPASVSLISRTMVEEATAINVAELFKSVPGVDLQGSAYPGAFTKPILRGHGPGLQSKRVLVLVDGRRVAEPFQSVVEFPLFPADSIERIEVLRGPASALYGSDAVAGVMNIITRRGTTEPVTELRAGYGSYALQNYGVAHGAATGPMDYFLTGSYQDTDGYIDNPDGTDRDWRALNLTGNFGLAIDDNSEVRLYAGYYDAMGTDADSDRDIEKDYLHGVYRMNWNTSRDAELLVRVYRNGDDQVFDWKFPGIGIFDMQTIGGEVQQSLWLGSRNRIVGGLDYRWDDVDIDNVTGPINEDNAVTGFYIQDDVVVSEAVKLTFGIRNDHDDDFGDELSPRIAGLWRHSENGEVFASFNFAHRAPALSDRFFVGEFDGRIFEGNPDLDPETLNAYEVGARQRSETGIEAEIALYYNDLEDSFEFAEDSDGVFRNRNVTRSRIYGIEVAGRVPLCSVASGQATYAYANGEYDEFPTDRSIEGNQLQYLSEHTATMGIAYRGRLGFHSIDGRYVDGRFADDRNTPERKLDHYVVVDWRSRVPVSELVTLTLNVDNIFDESYSEFFGIPQPGTTVFGGVEVAL